MANFEKQLAELEKIVDQLEKGDMTLEENVALFERGVILSDACKVELASAESRIQVLLDPKLKGEVRVEDLAPTAAEQEESSEEDDDGRL